MMKKSLLSLLLLFIVLTAAAIPAKRGRWRLLTLPDGTEQRAQLRGDEFCHYWQTADGRRYTLSDGVCTELTRESQTTAAARRQRARRRRVARLASSRQVGGPRRAASTTYVGERRGLIILVNFKDKQFRTGHNQALYNDIANKAGYTSNEGFRGSVADYFSDQSRGKFRLTFDVVGPVKVENNYKYYGQNDADGNDKHPEEMVAEAVNLVKNQVSDWHQYDWDNDGEVDQVMVIYAGEGEASSDDENTIWPHEYELWHDRVQVATGLYVNTYAVANEVEAVEGRAGTTRYRLTGIGTICHEFSHCLGLPDMYDTYYSGCFGMGDWSVMDAGSYAADGFVPCNYTSYEKTSIGWVTPTPLTEAVTVSGMRPLSQADDIYVVTNAAYPNEYYLLENRRAEGWDESLPSSGLLVLHVDYDQRIWEYNMVNTLGDPYDGYVTNDHQRCTIFHADGKDISGALEEKITELVEKYYERNGRLSNAEWDDYERYLAEREADLSGDTYPSPTGNNRLSNTSLPRTFTYHNNTDGRRLMNVSITDIALSDQGLVSFRFAPDATGSGQEGDNTQTSLQATAIHTLPATAREALPAAIYTPDGRYCGTDLSRLPAGRVYIQGGRKVVK